MFVMDIDDINFKTKRQIQKHAQDLDERLERQERAGTDTAARVDRWMRHRALQEPEPAHPDAPRPDPRALPRFASYMNGSSHFQLVAPQQIPRAATFNTRTDYADEPIEPVNPSAAGTRIRNAIVCSECNAKRHTSASQCIVYRYFNYLRESNAAINRQRGESEIKAVERMWRGMNENERTEVSNLINA